MLLSREIARRSDIIKWKVILKLISKCILLSLVMLSLLLASCTDSAAPIYQGPDIKVLEATQLNDLEAEFQRYSYQLDQLDKGVPPLIIQTLPKDLPNLPSSKKKRIFLKSMLPMILLANKEIRQERKQLLEIKKRLDSKQLLSEEQRQILASLAQRYDLNSASLTSPEVMLELLVRVDVIPAELAIAQAANESAWGTSRFSQLANNLFGEWTFIPGTGIVPEGRPEGETYEIRRFESVYESIRSYLRNLNTHYAYRELRQLRTEARQAGAPLEGSELAEGLFRYSIRGEDYVKDLQGLIRQNQLSRFADTDLRLRG